MAASPNRATEVSVLIPAYEAEAFIDRTLRCAREQTHGQLRILVSVDLSADETVAACRAHAAQDPRIKVVDHRERLGWAGNVNYLLDRVTTDYAFIYFHDDVIEPTYVARLLADLRERPDAASAHCDVGHFGASKGGVPGRAIEGTTAERVLDFLTGRRPSLPRSLLRSELAGDIRLPTGAAGIWAHEPFVTELVAAGPALHRAETLYSRWNHRPGGLTERWRTLPFEEVLAGLQLNAKLGLELIDRLRPSQDERDLLLFGLFLHMTRSLRRAEAIHELGRVTQPEALSEAFARIEVPAALDDLPAPLRAQCEDAYRKLLRKTGVRALEAGDPAYAAQELGRLTDRHPESQVGWRRLAQALDALGRKQEAARARRRAGGLRAPVSQ